MSHDEYKARLETELSAITAELNTIASFDEHTSDWVAVPVPSELQTADKNAEADAVEEWEARRAVLSQLETRYRNVKRALEKITLGTYGICEISGEPIEGERLQANPSARTNIANKDRESELPL